MRSDWWDISLHDERGLWLSVLFCSARCCWPATVYCKLKNLTSNTVNWPCNYWQNIQRANSVLTARNETYPGGPVWVEPRGRSQQTEQQGHGNKYTPPPANPPPLRQHTHTSVTTPALVSLCRVCFEWVGRAAQRSSFLSAPRGWEWLSGLPSSALGQTQPLCACSSHDTFLEIH